MARDTYAGIGDRSDVRFIGYAPDEDLPALYKGAEMFAFPSLVEGFGLPPLEAMACGVPVVASTISTRGPTATPTKAVHPRDVRSIADGLLRLTRDRERRRAPDRAWAGVRRALHLGGGGAGGRALLRGGPAAQRCRSGAHSDLPARYAMWWGDATLAFAVGAPVR
ncbi:MAG: glycosyltransferase [Dehalococcoidia bacterium]